MNGRLPAAPGMLTLTIDDWFWLRYHHPDLFSPLCSWLRSELGHGWANRLRICSITLGEGVLHLERCADPVQVIDDEAVVFDDTITVATPPPCWPAGIWERER